MTKSELARDKLKYWSLISRARKVGFSIPIHWMKYGEVPIREVEIVSICLDLVSDKLMDCFETDSFFYRRIK